MYLLIINILCLIDTLIKYNISPIPSTQSISIYIMKFNIHYKKNYGYAFSLGHTQHIKHIQTLHLIIIISLCLATIYNGLDQYLIAVLIGSLYNLFDRYFNGYVIDYLRIELINKYMIVFNQTDIIILINYYLFLNNT